ncbi:heparinase II/III domain-containing protein [Terrimonas pollutisoli]|uniref:heparinase II/III domain-containing protein n=1 Tax=Terrimonas pollutisoli TaxID=3034147 RepID=UPI0023ED9FB2|nr:heparinase II/III family protein [Terrimonas sp. H1YJ31]
MLICSCAFSQEGIGKVKAHPYLFYTAGNIKAVKENLRKDTVMEKAWREMLANADAAATAGKGGSMEELSFAYRMTGDKKYALQAKTLLQDLLKRGAWDGLDDRSPRWNSALGTARYNGMSAITFDAIYDILTPGEKKQMAERIVTLGIEPSLNDWISADKRLHTLNSMGHNWWSSIVYQAGIASLAIMNEVPKAKKWAEDVMQSADEWFAFSGSVLENKPSSFDPAGGFYESISYANFGFSEYLFFRVAWTNAVSKILKPYDPLLEKTLDWFIQMSYPASGKLQSVNFGDTNPYANGDRPVKLMMALGFTKKRYEWYLSKTKRDRIKEDLGIHTPLGLLYSPVISSSEPAPDLPTSAIYENMGWASMRSSWKENASMLAIKSGYTWNHAHADAGSFILYHNGKNLLIDGGNVNYGNPLYSSYSVRSDAHNVILFNGKAQDPQDQYHAVKNTGHLYNLMDAGNFKYILADATGPTSHYFLRNYRNVVWVGNVILILDDVKTYDQGKFEWLLHTAVDARKKGIDLDITDGNASVLVRPLFPETLPNGYPHDFPEKMRLEEKQGVKDHEPNTKVTYYSISPAEELKQTKFITAIILLDDKNKPIEGPSLSGMASAKEMRTALPGIEKLEGNNYIGVRITDNGITTDVYFNLMADGRIMHRNSHNEINGWETDAYLLGVTYKEGTNPLAVENINSWFVANGSYIRKKDEVILHSLSKVFLHANLDDETPRILLQGQPLIRAELSVNKKAANVKLNGQAIKAVYSDKKMLQLKTGG